MSKLQFIKPRSRLKASFGSWCVDRHARVAFCGSLAILFGYARQGSGMAGWSAISGILSGRMGRVATMPGHPSLTMAAGLACAGLFAVAVAAALLRPFVKGDHRRRTLDDIPMGIYRTAPDGRLLMANPHLVQMLGYSDSAELLEHKLADAAARPEHMEQAFQEMIDRDGQVKGLEYTWNRRDGSVLQVRENAKAVYGATGKLLYYEGTVEDISDRKHLEMALNQSEQEYRGLFERANDIILIIAPEDGRVLDANGKACQFFGLIKNRLEGVDLGSIFGRIRARETINEIAQASTADGLETVYTLSDGRQIILQSNSSKITYRGMGATLAIFRDVTQHKRDADALRDSQSLMTSVLDCLPQKIFCKDLDGRYTVANKSFADWNGLRSDEIVGRTDFELYPEEVASKYMADDRSVFESGKAWDVVEEVLSQHGERIFIEVLKTPQLDETGKTLGVLGSFWDITDKKLTEENLGRERDFLTALMDSIPDAIYFKDRDAKMTRINKAQASLLGLSDPSEAVGKTVFDFFGEAAPAFHEDDQRILISGKSVVDSIKKLKGPRGEPRWVSATKVPIRSEDGRISGLVGVSRDITERKLMEQKLEHDLEAFLKVVSRVSDGDLRVRGSEGSDTLGMIAASVNEMLEKFVVMLNTVRDLALSVSSSATEILAASEQIANGAARQADEITNTSSTVEEMAASMVQVSRNAEESAGAARQALSMAEAGEHSVKDTFEAMNRINQTVQAAAERMNLLANRTSEISEIMDLINEIAAQTNLLSLNAAIEAAHAGDAGLGFSVVAEEIRKLAERSARATRDVSTIIKAIQKESEAALSAMDLGMKEVVTGSSRAEKASDSLRNIFSVVKQSSELIEEISASAEEQAKVTRQLAQAMQTISNITHETSAGAHQTAATLQAMVGVSEQLNQAIFRFKVD